MGTTMTTTTTTNGDNDNHGEWGRQPQQTGTTTTANGDDNHSEWGTMTAAMGSDGDNTNSHHITLPPPGPPSLETQDGGAHSF